MINLSSTSDILRMVTGSAVASVTVSTSWVEADFATTPPSVTDANSNISVVTTDTTTTLVSAPNSSTKRRNIKSILITNNNATLSTPIVIQHFNGTLSADLFGVTLLPGENAVFGEDGNWRHHDAQGAEYGYAPPAVPNLGPTGAISETVPRMLVTSNTTPGASGTLFLQAIYLTAGQIVGSIGMMSSTTSAATTTNMWFALYDINRNLLAQSAAQGAYTWTSNTAKILAMTTPYRITTSGLYYVGILQIATTIATVHGPAAKANSIVASTPPVLHGSSTSALSALPNPAGAPTGGTASIYAWITST